MKPLALTMGDPAGIGTEVSVKAWSARADNGLPPFLLVDTAERVAAAADSLGLDAAVAEISTPAEAVEEFATALPVLPVDAGDPASPAAVIASMEQAIALALEGAVGGVVTNPVNKARLYESGFSYPGQTEYFIEKSGATAGIMMLAVPGLRVIPVTVHIPLAEVPAKLTESLVESAGRIADAALKRDFGITRPRLAVAGLNPHAGEEGALGREEETVIAPAIKALQAAGIKAKGPFPADTLFHDEAREKFDAVLCMYHDQALIPLKTLDFWNGVNVTLGLPIVRTSPDHGTAENIAGKGIADARSLIAAIRLAGEMAARRAASE